MMRLTRGSSRRQRVTPRSHRVRPRLETLEDRRLLYATLGAKWPVPLKITYSFVPDGTSIGGSPSTLFQTLNAKFPTEVWQREFQIAAAVWQAVANVNLVQVGDAGGNIDIYGNQQGDYRFGDIRISAIPLPFGTMGVAFSPPPINGGTAAGDVVMNSIMDWKINSHWDLRTVAIHEIGHALGMDHSMISAATMYSYYTVMKQQLNADDIAGIQSIYHARQPDVWNSNGESNAFWMWTKNLDDRRTSQNQIKVEWLNMHQTGMSEWFWVTIPTTNSGRMEVRMQSTGFSSLSPHLEIYDTALTYRGGATSSKFGDTITATLTSFYPGQIFLIKASSGTGGSTGMFGLQVNFGSTPLPPLVTAYTVTPWQPNLGGGGLMSMKIAGEGHDDFDSHVELVKLGDVVGWGDSLMVAGGGHAPEYLEAVERGARRLDELAATRILASAAFDPTFGAAQDDLSPAIAPSQAAPVPPPARPGVPFRSWRGWALSDNHEWSTVGAKRLVGSLSGL